MKSKYYSFHKCRIQGCVLIQNNNIGYQFKIFKLENRLFVFIHNFTFCHLHFFLYKVVYVFLFCVMFSVVSFINSMESRISLNFKTSCFYHMYSKSNTLTVHQTKLPFVANVVSNFNRSKFQ